jgi:hypothetical protein
VTPEEAGPIWGALVGALVVLLALGGPLLFTEALHRLRLFHRRGLDRVRSASRKER